MLRKEITIERQPAEEPEWGRIPGAVRRFGMSRSKFYELIWSRKIKSLCLRESGKTNGIRLIHFPSVREFLEREAKAQERKA
jgi:hypothetical protein